MFFYGYYYNAEWEHEPPARLDDKQAVIRYIKEHIEAPQLIIVDSGQRQLLLMREGVDLFNKLDRIGISLSSIYEQIRNETLGVNPQVPEMPEWERLYDQVGLSPSEIRMRQRVKTACRSAQSVADVADLIHGTYFDAHFLSTGRQQWFRFFNEKDYSADVMVKNTSGVWTDCPERVSLDPSTKIRHLRSSEDIHTFEILE